MNKFLFKKTVKPLLFLFAWFLSFSSIQAQDKLKINEILVHNDSGYVDDYGRRGSWIEIFNSGYTTLNLGGMFLTNDLANPKKYRIPKGFAETSLPPRSFAVFFAEGEGAKGVFHTNFELKEGDVIGLFQANGKVLVDSVTIIGQHSSNTSFGRETDGSSKWTMFASSTPRTNNVENLRATGAETFGVVDPYGIGMAAVAMSVVFTILAMLFYIFKYMSVFINREKKVVTATVTPGMKPEKAGVSGEISAVIALALYLNKNQSHDLESTVLTMHKVSRTYSPWSSKIYGMTKNPRS
jgi:Na+-transporting methylmalonyl-CoA/oxaloacetate decarboxylase gamma subunit